MTKTDSFFPAFCVRSVDPAVDLCFRCNFSIPRHANDARLKFDRGVISLNQSQFFVTHSNQ